MTTGSRLPARQRMTALDLAGQGHVRTVWRATDYVPVLGLGLTLALAASLRLVSIDQTGFTSDEAVYAGQAAAMVGEQPFDQFFSLFRAHPLLLQLTLGAVFKVTGVSDVVARIVMAVVGLGAVVVTYKLAGELYGRGVAWLAALLLAIVPYHVLISRQVMVDALMAFFVVLALWLFARGLRTASSRAFLAGVIAAGAATLTKEVAALLPAIMALYLFATGRWRVLPGRVFAYSVAFYGLAVAPGVVSRLLGPSGNASRFILWQLSRPQNHEADYFLRVLLQFTGMWFLILLLVGFLVHASRRSTADLLICVWLGVFMLFFQLWPTKLFTYLMPIMPALAISGAVGMVRLGQAARGWLGSGRLYKRTVAIGLGAVLALGVVTSWLAVTAFPDRPTGFGDLDIELQDFAGGREVGLWARANTPADARFLTIGPSVGNILRFYGYRDSVAFSVSPDPSRHNPAYVPVANPDRALRDSAVQYIVWDAYSADRSVFYHARLMRYVREFSGIPVFAAYVDLSGALISIRGPAPTGADVRFVVYSVAGGSPLQRDS